MLYNPLTLTIIQKIRKILKSDQKIRNTWKLRTTLYDNLLIKEEIMQKALKEKVSYQNP